VQAAHEIGLDSISFLAADLTSDALTGRPGTAKDIAADPCVLEEEIRRPSNPGSVADSFANLRRSYYGS